MMMKLNAVLAASFKIIEKFQILPKIADICSFLAVLFCVIEKTAGVTKNRHF